MGIEGKAKERHCDFSWVAKGFTNEITFSEEPRSKRAMCICQEEDYPIYT